MQQRVKVGYYPAKFGGHSLFGSEVITNLVCHVILQDHVINASCDFWVGAPHDMLPPCQVWWP